MKKAYFGILFLIFILNCRITNTVSHLTTGPSEDFHVFGVEDIFEKEKAEKIIGKKIIEAPDTLGPDSLGEDIFLDDDEYEEFKQWLKDNNDYEDEYEAYLEYERSLAGDTDDDNADSQEEEVDSDIDD